MGLVFDCDYGAMTIAVSALSAEFSALMICKAVGGFPATV